MKNSKAVFVLVALLFAGLMAAAAVLYGNLSSRYDSGSLAAQEDPSRVILAPDFTVTGQDGSQTALSDFLGTPVVLNFWASWCGPCKSEMPAFDTAWAEYSDRVQFMMVNLTDNARETQASARDFLDGSGYSFPVFFDTGLSAAAAYGVTGIPVTYFINARGQIVARASAAMDYDTLVTGIGLLLED